MSDPTRCSAPVCRTAPRGIEAKSAQNQTDQKASLDQIPRAGPSVMPGVSNRIHAHTAADPRSCKDKPVASNRMHPQATSRILPQLVEKLPLGAGAEMCFSRDRDPSGRRVLDVRESRGRVLLEEPHNVDLCSVFCVMSREHSETPRPGEPKVLADVHRARGRNEVLHSRVITETTFEPKLIGNRTGSARRNRCRHNINQTFAEEFANDAKHDTVQRST